MNSENTVARYAASANELLTEFAKVVKENRELKEQVEKLAKENKELTKENKDLTAQTTHLRNVLATRVESPPQRQLEPHRQPEPHRQLEPPRQPERRPEPQRATFAEAFITTCEIERSKQSDIVGSTLSEAMLECETLGVNEEKVEDAKERVKGANYHRIKMKLSSLYPELQDGFAYLFLLDEISPHSLCGEIVENVRHAQQRILAKSCETRVQPARPTRMETPTITHTVRYSNFLESRPDTPVEERRGISAGTSSAWFTETTGSARSNSPRTTVGFGTR
jgi:hypothetical protein